MTETPLCQSCRRAGVTTACPLCQGPVCKRCTEEVPDGAFPLLTEEERKFVPGTQGYCGACFDSTIAPELQAYEELANQARQVWVISSRYRGQLPVEKKALEWVSAKDMTDRKQLVLRLALMAARQGFNGLIQAELVSRKVRNHGWQKSLWSGEALPAQLNEKRLVRMEGVEQPEGLEVERVD